MDRIHRNSKRDLPFSAMGISVPTSITYSFPRPKIPRLDMRNYQISAPHHHRHVSGEQGQRGGHNQQRSNHLEAHHRVSIQEPANLVQDRDLDDDFVILEGDHHAQDVEHQQEHWQHREREQHVQGEQNEVHRDHEHEHAHRGIVQEHDHGPHTEDQLHDTQRQINQTPSDSGGQDQDQDQRDEMVNISLDIFHDSTDPDPNRSDNEVQDEIQDDYFDLLHNYSKEWLAVQLTHQVSLKATDKYWQLSLKWMPRLLAAKNRQNLKRKIPKFQNQRNKFFNRECPRIGMNFVYKHNDTGEIKYVNDVDTAPKKRFDQDPHYTKLYETAFIQVITITIILLIGYFTIILLIGYF